MSGHTLELIITRSSNDIRVLDSFQPSLQLSDHFFVDCRLNIPGPGLSKRMVQFLSSPLYTDPADCIDDLTGKSLLLSLLLGKLGLELIYKNVRPVGNLPFIGKSTQRAVIGQLPDHCTAYAPLPNNQSSYRQGHSTETALLKVHSDMLMNMDKQEVTLVVLLNVGATFDTIDHKTFLEILETDFGVVGNAKKWT